MADDLQYKVYILEGQETFLTETKEYALKKEAIDLALDLSRKVIEKNIDEEISKNNLSQKIFIIPDLGVKEGNAVIETESGKLIVGIDSVLDKVKEMGLSFRDDD